MNLAAWAERNDVARVTGRATLQQIPVGKVVVEVGSALNGHRRKFLALLGDPFVLPIVAEHRDRLCRFGSEYVQAALAAQGQELVWWTSPRSMTTWCGI
jgi:predicted site-specific integrase-resolvase